MDRSVTVLFLTHTGVSLLGHLHFDPIEVEVMSKSWEYFCIGAKSFGAQISVLETLDKDETREKATIAKWLKSDFWCFKI